MTLPTELPPHDFEAEEACLAACLVDADAIAPVIQICRPEHYFRETHGWIHTAIAAVWDRHEDVNQITVAHELAQQKRLEDVGGQTFLAEMVRRLPTSVGVEFYCHIVRNMARARAAIHASSKLMHAVYEAPDDTRETLNEWTLRLMQLADDRRLASAMEPREFFEEHGAEVMDYLIDPHAVRGVRTPWPGLDRLLGGLLPSRLYVVMADSSVGKSLFLQDMARGAALDGSNVLFFTGEMSAKEVYTRVTHMLADVDPAWGNDRPFTGSEMARVNNALGQLAELPIRIDNNLQLSSLRAETRRMAASGRCDIVFVDHIQDIDAGKTENATERIRQAVKGLKDLAVTENVPVVAVSHIDKASMRDGIKAGSGMGGAAILQWANHMLILEPVRWTALPSGKQGWVPFSIEELAEHQRTNNTTPVRIRLEKQRAGKRTSMVLYQDWNLGGRYVQGGAE